MPTYEVNSGDVLETVQAYCRHLCGTGGFGTATQPTLVEVQQMNDNVYYKIGGALTQSGYALLQSGSSVVGFLQGLQSLEVAIAVELAYPVTGAGEPNSRFEEFCKQRDWYYQMIADGALGDLGGTPNEAGTGPTATVTGVSFSRKAVAETDADFVPHRFRRGQFTQPGSMTTGTSESAAG